MFKNLHLLYFTVMYLDFKTSQPYNSFILFIKTIYQHLGEYYMTLTSVHLNIDVPKTCTSHIIKSGGQIRKRGGEIGGPVTSMIAQLQFPKSCFLFAVKIFSL